MLDTDFRNGPKTESQYAPITPQTIPNHAESLYSSGVFCVVLYPIRVLAEGL